MTTAMNALERRAAGAAFATLGLVLAGHSVLETARDALFLRSLPPTQLPWVYLIIAVITLGLTVFESALARGLRRRALLPIFLLASAVVTASLWAAADFVSVGSIWLLYVWTGVFGTLATIHFWLSVSAAFTVTQAKRLFGFVGAGALGGAIAGSAFARVLVTFTATRNLVLLAAGCMLAAALAAHLTLRAALRKLSAVSGDGSAESEPVRMGDALRAMRTEPYVRRVVLFVLLATVAITLADYLFKRGVASDIPPEHLGAFFATFYASLNVVALIVQILVVGWLLDRVGVPRTLSILPALLFGGGLWAALTGGLPAVLFLRATNGSLKHSLHQTATEVLFVPLPGRERNQAKTVADVIGHRVGQALASLAILVGLWVVDQGRWIAWAIAVIAAFTAYLALRSRRAYLDVFRRKLGDTRPGARRLPPLDRHALEVLFAALDSPREREVIASLDVFHEQGRIDLVPALILHHPSPRVVSRALRWFVAAGRRNFVSTALRVDTDDPDLRAALLRAIAVVEPDVDVLRDALEDSSRRVRATAIVELTSLGAMGAVEARRRLEELLEHPGARRAIAAALAVRPCPALTELLRELAADDDLSVRAEAVHAIAASGDPSLWPVLLASLRERALRPLARRGFAAGGGAALRFLAAALHDTGVPPDVRLHVPRSISHFDAPSAAPLLWSRLLGEPDPGVRYKILRALGALAQKSGGLVLDDEEVGQLIAAGLARCRRIAVWHAASTRAVSAPRRDTATGAVLRDLLAEELAHELELVFRTLALRHRGEDFRTIQRGLSSDDPVVRASCEELLSEVVPHEDRRALLELSRIDLGAGEVDPELALPAFGAALAAMIDGRNDAVAAIAASYAAELDEKALAPRIAARVTRAASPDMRAVLERASRRLDAQTKDVAHG